MKAEVLKALSFDLAELYYIAPEIFLFSSMLAILLISLFLKGAFRQLSYYLSQLTLALSAVLTWLVLPEISERIIIFSNSFILDYFAGVLKIFVYIFAMIILLYSRHYLLSHKLYKGEFFVLFLSAVLGMSVLISGYSLLTIYLGLELLSLSFYTLIAFATQRTGAIEAALKYFVLAAIASGILLYGMSMIYGISGSINIADISDFAKNTELLAQRELLVLNFGLVFIIIGIAFKLGAVPFHMWLPDVYEGSPTATTMLLATIPKLAVLAMLMRLLVEALGGLLSYWQDILMLLAISSIIIGALVAILQSDIKRMLAYSTISHIGFILLGFVSGVISGYVSAFFYTLAYILSSLVAFGVIILLNKKGFEAQKISDYKGLAKTNPWFALLMLIAMLSMAGVPPFIGFYAKFFILQQIISAGFIYLGIIAVIFAVVSAYYYLGVIKAMYFESSEKEIEVSAHIDMQLMLSINALLIVIIGIFPDYFLELSSTLLKGF